MVLLVAVPNKFPDKPSVRSHKAIGWNPRQISYCKITVCSLWSDFNVISWFLSGLINPNWHLMVVLLQPWDWRTISKYHSEAVTFGLPHDGITYIMTCGSHNICEYFFHNPQTPPFVKISSTYGRPQNNAVTATYVTEVLHILPKRITIHFPLILLIPAILFQPAVPIPGVPF